MGRLGIGARMLGYALVVIDVIVAVLVLSAPLDSAPLSVVTTVMVILIAAAAAWLILAE